MYDRAYDDGRDDRGMELSIIMALPPLQEIRLISRDSSHRELVNTAWTNAVLPASTRGLTLSVHLPRLLTASGGRGLQGLSLRGDPGGQ